MMESNVAITKEEAELVFKTPTINVIKVKKETTLKLLVYMLKNHLLHFETVEIHATGGNIAKAVTAAKVLEDDHSGVLNKLETDLVGEEPQLKPKVHIIVARPRK